jgi:hypothetical protein
MINNSAKMELLGAVQQLHDHVANMSNKVEAKEADNCLNCAFFKEKKEICRKYKMRPPARTIAEGCPEWDIDIPF